MTVGFRGEQRAAAVTLTCTVLCHELLDNLVGTLKTVIGSDQCIQTFRVPLKVHMDTVCYRICASRTQPLRTLSRSSASRWFATFHNTHNPSKPAYSYTVVIQYTGSAFGAAVVVHIGSQTWRSGKSLRMQHGADGGVRFAQHS